MGHRSSETPPRPSMPETTAGLIERVTYHNPENGFAVLRVKLKGRPDLVTVVSSTTSVTAGEHLEASGSWSIDREHCQQLKADQLKTTHPASAEGIEKYLASGAIRSIGPKMAARIVAVNQERPLETAQQQPTKWLESILGELVVFSFEWSIITPMIR